MPSGRIPQWTSRRVIHAIAVAAVLGIMVGGPVGGASPPIAFAQELTVPLIAEQRPALDMGTYAGRTSVAFTVYDCATSQPLAAEAANAASTWNIDAPVTLSVQVADDGCEGDPSNDRNEIYFVHAPVDGPEVGDYQPRVDAGRLVAEDLRVSMPNAIERARSLGTSVQIVLFNQLMNAYGHVLGLGDAHADHPDICHGSTMLGNCRLQRTMPSAADRDALARIYGADLDLHRELRTFDADGDGRIDDAEFRAGLRQWIGGRVSDDVFLELLEVWTQGKRVSGGRVKKPTSASTAIRLYDLSGRRVAERRCGVASASRLERWLNAGSTLPRGTYIARIRNCQTGAVHVQTVARR